MTIKGKGKDVAGKGKAPIGRGDGDGSSGGGRKRKNRGVLQFFEDTTGVDDTDDSEYSDFGDDFVGEDIDMAQTNNEPAKGQNLPFFPKEEMIDEEEFDKMMEERYGDGSRFFTFAGDEFDDKAIEPNSVPHVANDPNPTIWKVKCTVGRERLSAFCLMQKFIDLKLLGTKLNIVSAFALDHMKGLIYIEAEKQCDINEACKGLSSIYVTRVQPVPKNEVSHLFNARSRCNEISEGMWVRVKSGIYKGDLAQVVAVNNARRRATVKLIPRIDLQAMAAKFGGGYNVQKGAVPAPRLISSSELEEFRPLMQIRRDRDTGKVFEILDGLMLKDGYLYKKVAIDSLNLWGVEPAEEELLKFRLSESNEENDLEWLSQIYGEPKKKRIIGDDKVGGKGGSSTGSGMGYSFELYDLVCFKRKEFGIIIGMEKDDSYKILKESAEGPVVVTVERRDVKSGSFDIKLSAQDQHKKTIFVNDTVRVLEGPSKDRQGIVKHIYRGVVFLHDENEEENGGYFTSKSHMCEKVKLSVGDYSGKGSEPGTSVFEDLPSSAKSPLSPKRPWQARENREFNRGDNDAPFTIGQTLRIRVGPLKGYICRVIAIRRSDVTVKLDSQQRVFTVKCENLSEVQGKRSATSTSGDPDSNSFKPFDLLGTGGSSGGWTDGVGTSAGNDGWNTGGVSTERSVWSSHSNFLQPESTANPISAESSDSGKGAEDTAWGVKSTSNQNSSWGAKGGADADPDQSGGWPKGGGSWGQAKPMTGSTTDENQNSGWIDNKPNDADGNQPSGWESKSSWNTPKSLQPGGSSATEWDKGSSKSGSDDGGNVNSTCGSGKSAEVNGRDGKRPSGWESRSNWNTTKTLQLGGSSATDWKSGRSEMDTEKPGGTSNESKEGNQPCGWENESNWNSPLSSSQGKKLGWNQKFVEDDKEGKGIDQDGWNSGTSGQASGWEKGTDSGDKSASTWISGSSGVKEGCNRGSFKPSLSGVEEIQNSGWGKVNNQDDKGDQDSSWGVKNRGTAVHGDDGNGQGNSWSPKSNCKSGSNYTEHGERGEADVSNDDTEASCRWHDGGANKNGNWGKNSIKDSENTYWKSGSGSGNSIWSTGCADAEIRDSCWSKKSNWNGENKNSKNLSWKSGVSSGNENQHLNWTTGLVDPETQVSDWGKGSNWNFGNVGNQDSENSYWKSGSGSGSENQNSKWSTGHADAETQDSNWGKKGNWNGVNSDSGNSSWKSGSGNGNGNQNSNWSTGCADAEIQDSNWGKKSNWNSGNGGNQDSGWNKSSNWGSGSGNTNQNTRWGRNNNWQHGNAAIADQSFGQNEDPNETPGGGGSSGNWRGRNGSDRGGFRGRGYRGRGERGGYGGGRGDSGGYGDGRGDHGGSERGFVGRGRGRRDQAGGWNNRRDSGEDGSSDWNKGGDKDVEGWKNSSGSGSWSQGSGEKDWQSWNSRNDKEPSSWSKGGGSNW